MLLYTLIQCPIAWAGNESMTHTLRALGVAVLLALAAHAGATNVAGENTPSVSLPTTASPGPVTTQGAVATPTAEEELAEVVIEAPEPVYVAPTLRDRIGRIWAPVRIDGKGPFRLVLDTGASHSAITSRVANRIDDATVQTVNVLLHGVTGSAIVPALKVRSMEVGDMLIEPTTLPIVADAFGGAEGVLGREGLMDKRIFADFGGDKLTIARSHGQRAPQGYRVVPLKLTAAGLLATDVRIGAVRVRAIIDTGAQQTVGNLALQDALMRRAPRDSIDENIIGVTLDEQHTKYIRVPPIVLGNLRLANVHVAFGDMALFDHWNYTHEPTLLIGMDVLGLFDKLVIDYKMRELQIRMRPNEDGSFPLQIDHDSVIRGS
jgi:predicted aspartyl protease